MSGTVENVAQHELTAVAGLSEDMKRARLRRVVWAAPRDSDRNIVGAPGLSDLRGTQRTMIVNDLTRFQVRARIRVRSLELLREVLHDPSATRVVVKGPTDASIVAGDSPWVDYEIGAEWREYPAVFASWLDYRRAEDRTLGAGYIVNKRVKELDPGGETVTRTKEFSVRPVDLFEFRLPGDDGEQQVVVPGATSGHAAELAELRAMIAALTRQVAGQVAEPVAAAVPTLVAAPGGAVSERFVDEPLGAGVTVVMQGGAFMEGHEGRQVGYDPEEAYDPDEGSAAGGELDAALRTAGAGVVKARRRG